MRKASRLVAVACLCSAALSAQQTWIVDPLGTGNFTDLNAAIAAASPGDTLILRGAAGFYSTVTVTKNLAIVAEGPQVPSIYDLVVQAQTGVVNLVGLVITQANLHTPTVCEDLFVNFLCQSDAPWLSMHHCTLSSWHSFFPPLLIGGGTLALSDCLVYGSNQDQVPMMGGACYNYQSSMAMSAGGADITATDCTFRGGFGMTSGYWACTQPALASSAIHLNGGSFHATRCRILSGSGQLAPVAVINGALVEFDASTTFVPSTVVGTMVYLPGTSATTAPPGGVIACSVETSPNLPAVLVASLGVRTPIPFPQATGPVWLDPLAYVVLMLGITDAQGSLAATIPVPAWAPRGLPITIQGAAALLNGPLTAAAPAIVQVH